MEVHVIAPEYPGYGVYEGKSSEASIISDAEDLMRFVKGELNWPEVDIIVIGRSIGSGPAIHLASTY